jgi:endonuclease III
VTKIEKLLGQPGVGQKVVRQVIATAAGNSASIRVSDGNRERVLKVTVLRQSDLRQSGIKPSK